MQYDIAVLGGGPGGYVAAIYASKKKAKVALVEKAEIGGTCLNRGCIPTKALIHSANLYKNIKQANKFGLAVSGVDINWDEIQHNQKSVVTKLTKGVESLLKANGVTTYQGYGELQDQNTIKVICDNTGDTITSQNIIIATGSIPSIIPIPGHDLGGVITSDEALNLSSIPKSMLIIGGGVIGIELAYIYNTFGTDITIVEMLPQILPTQDDEVVKQLHRALKRQGIKIYTGAKVISIQKADEKLNTSFETEEGGRNDVITEKVLMAVGRKPNLKAVGNVNIEANKTGIYVDEYMKTNIHNIFAIGDVTGKSMLAHVASHQGLVAIKNALGDMKTMDYKVIPSCVYTSPELASVGLTEREAREKLGDNIKIGRFPYAASGKALTIGEQSGIVKIISDEKYNQVLGVHIMGEKATELIAEATLAIKLECTAEELADTIHAHPTLSETIMEASLDLLGTPIHKI